MVANFVINLVHFFLPHPRPSQQFMHLMNLDTSMFTRSATQLPLASGGEHYDPNESFF